MLNLLLYLSYVAATYALIKLIYDMFKKKKWSFIRKSHEFIILIISVLIVTCLFVPWSDFHYGDLKTVTIHDTLKAETHKRVIKDSPTTILIPHPKTHKEKFKTFKTKDTVSKNAVRTPGQNGVAVQGNGNHIVAGTGNNVAVNGDVILGKKQRLFEYAFINQLNSMDQTQKNITIRYDLSDPEAKIYCFDVYNNLKRYGYKVEYEGIASAVPFNNPNNLDVGFVARTDKNDILIIIYTHQ